jgi:hypothetical protein
LPLQTPTSCLFRLQFAGTDRREQSERELRPNLSV